MYFKLTLVLVFISLVNIGIALTLSGIKFTNIKCEEFDTKFATFEECRLRVLTRNTVALHIYVKLFQLPVNNVSINLSLLKKVNGYKPFLYNVSSDFCQFMRKQRKNLFLKIFFDLLTKSSNINHTCPYNHDIIVRSLVLKDSMFKFLPLPSGEYMFILKVAAYNSWKADVKAYFQFNEIY